MVSKILMGLFVTFVYSGNVDASGCGSYDYWLTTKKTQAHSPLKYSTEEFKIIAQGKTFVKIALQQSPNSELTLPLEMEMDGDLEWQNVELLREDVDFSEGNGCGPVYECSTGRYTLILPPEDGTPVNQMRLRKFSWPLLVDYFDAWPRGWAASSLLPLFLRPTPAGDSDIKQCDYGNW